MLIKDIPWKRFYPYCNAWTFGTMIKFVALKHFTETYNETFVWLDMDVYPTEAAYHYKIPYHNYLYAPLIDIGFCEQPGHEHMKRKLEWCGHNQDYLALSSGMFILDRATAFSLWDWLNKDHPINSQKWWDSYYEKQLSHSKDNPYYYGSEEMLMEDWLNKTLPHFHQLTDDIHSIYPEHNPKFLHYYGTNKANYPMQVS